MSKNPPPSYVHDSFLDIEVEIGFGEQSRKEKKKYKYIRSIFVDVEDNETRVDEYEENDTGRRVVLKEHFPRKTCNVITGVNFERMIYSKFPGHPYLIQLLGYITLPNNNPVLLFPMLREDPLPIVGTVIRNYFKQVITALAFLHSSDLNIIHGNLKPDNIFYDSTTNKIIIIDFGDSRFHNRKYPYKAAGSGIFEAPEQKSLRFGRRSDVWSAGMTLAELVLGGPSVIGSKVPRASRREWKASFSERDRKHEEAQEEAKKAGKEYPPVQEGTYKSLFWSQFRPADSTLPYNLTRELDDLLHQMTKHDPKKRIRSSEILLHPYLQDT